MTTTPTKWSGQVIFDPNPLAIDTAPKLLTLADDTFILGWEDGSNIFARHLSEFGSFTGGNFLSSVSSTADQLIQPQFVQQPDGRVVVEFNRKIGSDFDTYWHQTNANFSPATFSGSIVGPTANAELIEAASASATGSAIVYTQSNIASTLLFTFVATNGLPASDTVSVGHTASTQQIQPVMEAIFNGDVAVAYTDFAVATGAQIRMHIYHRNTSTGLVEEAASGTEVTVSNPNVTGTSNADIATLNNGTLNSQIDDNLIVVWQDNTGLNFRRFSNETAGPLDNVPVHLDGTVAGDVSAHVTGLNDGGFMVAWRHDFGSGDDGIILRRYDKEGVPIGNQIIVNDAGDEGNFGIQLGTLDDGRVVLAFTNGPADPTTAVTTLDYIIFDPREKTINGSATADTIVGRKDGSTIKGLDGSDHLIGMNAKDILRGGNGNDILEGGKGADSIFGDAGRDVITGGTHRDILRGGANPDQFDFNVLSDSKVGGQRDKILDFSHAQHDKIDLRDIDANTHRGGNQKFKFIGDDAFSHKEGELRQKGHVIQGDVDGDGKAEFEIYVNNTHLKGGDFFL